MITKEGISKVKVFKNFIETNANSMDNYKRLISRFRNEIWYADHHNFDGYDVLTSQYKIAERYYSERLDRQLNIVVYAEFVEGLLQIINAYLKEQRVA